MKKLLLITLLLPALCYGKPEEDIDDHNISQDTHTANLTYMPIFKRLTAHGARLLNIAEPTVYVNRQSSEEADAYMTPGAPSSGPRIYTIQSFHRQPYPIKKFTIFHELNHCWQVWQNHDARRTKCTDLAKYPRGKEQEADAKAMVMINCPACAHDLACSMVQVRKRNFTCAEFTELAKNLPQPTLCPYHCIVTKRLSYKIACGLYHLGTAIYPENFGDTTYRKQFCTSKNIPMYGTKRILLGFARIPFILNKMFFNYTTRWIGRDVEEKIAKGELDV